MPDLRVIQPDLQSLQQGADTILQAICTQVGLEGLQCLKLLLLVAGRGCELLAHLYCRHRPSMLLRLS